ncbi:oxidoreductase [Parasphingorhabdus sp.]|uniref:oxidoreductase n=1 Tax=Parasphingorhabdus sp. TaxID=2709688 RepID=UPI003594177B
MTIRNFTDKDVPDQSGRVFFVTGANSGLGYAAAKLLAGRGARVLLGCRSSEKAKEAMGDIRSVYPEADLRFIPLDLGDLQSVRAAAALVAEEPRLDVLLNNAGIMMPPREETVDGFESQFGVNHLGTFALTGLLLDKLAAGHSPRVVITSSMAHRSGQIDFDDINADKSYSRWGRYAMSKLANLLHMYELDRRLRAGDSPIIATACHPGVADTELARHFPAMMISLLRPVTGLFMNSAAQGAWPTLAAAAGTGVESGQYFGPSRNAEWTGPAREVRPHGKARRIDPAKSLWAISEKMTGVTYPV